VTPKFKFFEYGEVSLEASDVETREASLRICMPVCLIQTVTPVLLGAGIIDSYALRNPIAVWIPTITQDRYKLVTQVKSADLAKRATDEIQKYVKEILDLFVALSTMLENPSDAIPMLPMGTYGTFRYRCTVDHLAHILEQLEDINVAGVPEFRFAMAGALARILSDWG
jgi:hypothetical protein